MYLLIQTYDVAIITEACLLSELVNTDVVGMMSPHETSGSSSFFHARDLVSGKTKFSLRCDSMSQSHIETFIKSLRTGSRIGSIGVMCDKCVLFGVPWISAKINLKYSAFS